MAGSEQVIAHESQYQLAAPLFPHAFLGSSLTYLASNARSTLVGAPSLTSTSCVTTPAFR